MSVEKDQLTPREIFRARVVFSGIDRLLITTLSLGHHNGGINLGPNHLFHQSGITSEIKGFIQLLKKQQVNPDLYFRFQWQTNQLRVIAISLNDPTVGMVVVTAGPKQLRFI